MASDEVTATVADGHGSARDGWLTGRPWPTIVLLMVIGIVNYLDRALPAILAQPIKQDLGLSDTALGAINGIGFLLVYALASIPIARVSDRGGHNLVIVASLAVWSAMTAVGGWVVSGWQFALSRAGVALGEAGGTPAAHAFIARNIPVASRTVALSVYGLCMPFGSMLGLVLGGIAGQHLGWRTTLVLMGVFGLGLSIVTWLCVGRRNMRVPAPIGPHGAHRPATLGALFRKRSLVAVLVGSSFMGMAGYTAITFTPAFLMRSHSMSLAEAGLSYGLAGGIGAIIGLPLLGVIASRLSRRDPRWLLGSVVLAITACLPLSFYSFSVADPQVALLGLALNHTIAYAYSAPAFAALHRLAPPQLRAQASALLLLATAILGGIGPVIAGRISDSLTPVLGDAALGQAMLVVPAAFALAALSYAFALASFTREIEPEAATA